MIVLSFGILLSIYAFIASKKFNVSIAFFLIFLIMGFQSNVDGDFYGYKYAFEHFTFEEGHIEKKEYFWKYLNYYFQLFTSFHVFIFCIALVECLCVKAFITRFADKQYVFISVLVFFFTFNYMLMQMKALRQGLAVDLCMLSFVMIDNKDKKSLLYAILLSLAACYTHKSSLICVIFVGGYWLYLHFSKVDKKFIRIKPIYLVIAIILLFVSKHTVIDRYIIPWMALLEDDHYMNYAVDFIDYSVDMTFLAILYDTILVFFMTKYMQFANPKERYFVIVGIIGIFADVLLFATGSIQRLLLYFNFANLVIFPGISKMIDKKYGKVALYCFFTLLLGYACKTSFHWLISMDADKFGNYQFVFLQ